MEFLEAALRNMAIVLVYNKGILVAKTCRGLLGKATLDKNSPNTSNVANTEKKNGYRQRYRNGKSLTATYWVW